MTKRWKRPKTSLFVQLILLEHATIWSGANYIDYNEVVYSDFKKKKKMSDSLYLAVIYTRFLKSFSYQTFMYGRSE